MRGGADLIIIETAQDILEVKAAIFGAREAFKLEGRALPIQCSVSLLPNGGKMLLGTDISAVLTTLEALEVDIIGLNCSTGPEDMRDAIRFLGETSSKPVHCIPNAGLPLQGPDGETIFPEQPEPLAAALGEFVERYGVGIVGGCCGTTPDHIRAIAERVKGLVPGERPAPRSPHLSSMIAATPLVQDPTPTLVGERVNSQGSRKAKEMLLADDYDGLVVVAEDQVTGGAHVLDICVALTERQDEDEQMRQTVKRISLTQPAPIQVDSTEPEVIQIALEQIPGRAIVNSINLEAGRDKLDRVVPIAAAHGAALIALTIDEVGMAKTADRKVEIAQRLVELCCDEHGLDREALIFDCLTFTLTTGDEEWRPSAVETIEGIRRIKAEIPGVKTSLGVSNVSFGVGLPARSVINSVFLHHCVAGGARPGDGQPEPHHPVRRDPAGGARARRRPRVQPPRGRARAADRPTSSPRAPRRSRRRPTRPPGWSPRRRCTTTSCAASGTASRTGSTAATRRSARCPTLNTVLLPAMKEVGDKFGAGELILPFVLQSAEVMKRAVARLENYLDKVEGYTKGTVVIATVFGDVHDIGKSLVNTILTNNGYTVVDLGKQVPISTILDAAVEHDATAIGLSALLVSTSKQMPACIQELHQRGLEFPVLIGGAAINRNFGLRILYPGGTGSDEIYEPGVFYCKDAFEGLAKMDQLIDAEAREALVAKTRDAARTLREAPAPEPDNAPPTTDSSVRSAARTDNPVPEPPFWGRREIEVPLDEVFHHLDTHVLFKLHWGGRGVKGEEWKTLLREDFQPRLERMWAEQDYLHPRAVLGYFPCNCEGNELIVWDPEAFDPADAGARAARLPPPAQARPDLPGRLLPARRSRRDRRRRAAGGHRRRRGHRADGQARGRRRVRRAAVRPRPRGADAPRAWPSGCTPACGASSGSGPPRAGGTRWGYPACPEQSEHEKVFRLLDAPGDRPAALRRLRRRARAVDAGDHRPPPAGGVLRDEVGLAAEERQAGRRRPDRRQRARPGAAGRAARRGPRRRRRAEPARLGGVGPQATSSTRAPAPGRMVMFRRRASSKPSPAGRTSHSRRSSRSTICISSSAKLAPRQRRRPPPNGIQVYVPGRWPRKRSGRKAYGSG